MKNFEGFGLSESLSKSLARMNYTAPTPIQAQAIPLALAGRDILGSAQTGTGKTAAFSIPLVEHVLSSPRGCALVLTPTRELAKQVLEVIHQLLGDKSPVKTAFIIGGEPMGKQFNQLKARPRIIVGTPGRINDHLERGSLDLDNTGFLVLDETDRMLDMGFGVQLDKILKFLPAQRQTLMFSATLPKGIVALSGKYMNKPERIAIGATNVIAAKIKQEIIRIEQDRKYEELINQLHERSGSVIVFVKTKHGCDRIARNLNRDDFEADALHGDLRQGKRTSVMNNFRKKKFRILIATDIAARGLDVPHIEHVINYDLPQVAEDYIHRMGRTARAGAEGSAVCFISNEDGRKWHAIECLLDPEAARSRKSGKFDRPQGKQKNFKKPGGSKRNFSEGRPPFEGKKKFSGQKPRPSNDYRSEGQDAREKPASFEKKPGHSKKKPFEGNKTFSSDKKKPFGSQKKSGGFKGNQKPGKFQSAKKGGKRNMAA